jgi:hypothetical protein
LVHAPSTSSRLVDKHGWHFDESDISTTLMLAAADAGGYFDYAPGIRRVDGPEATTVVAVLLLMARLEATAALRRLRMIPGALAVFKGCKALHRVTGNATHLVAVLTTASRAAQSPAVTAVAEAARAIVC